MAEFHTTVLMNCTLVHKGKLDNYSTDVCRLCQQNRSVPLKTPKLKPLHLRKMTPIVTTFLLYSLLLRKAAKSCDIRKQNIFPQHNKQNKYDVNIAA